MAITESQPLVRTVSGTDLPAAGTYDIDVAHTHAGFAVRHLMVSKVRGRLTPTSGTVVIGDDPTESSVEVEFDLTGIDTGDGGRDAHLRSADFFDIENHPTMRYRSTAVRPGKRGQWVVDGELTIRDVTRPVQLDVTFEGAATPPWGGPSHIGFSASTKVDREDFGLTWNQALETGGVVVGKDITIDIEAEATPA